MCFTRVCFAWCLFFASCSQREVVDDAPHLTTNRSEQVRRHTDQLPAVLAVVQAGLEQDFPAYMSGFSRAQCVGEPPDLRGLDMCAEAVGVSPSEQIERFCVQMSVKALIVDTVCASPPNEVERHARLAVYYSLALSRADPSPANPTPSVRLMAALAISAEYLTGQERCVPVRQFIVAMRLASSRYVSIGDTAAARAALSSAVRYAEACVSEVEMHELLSARRAIEAAQRHE